MINKGRPRIKLELSTTDKVFEVLGWAALIIFWAFTLVNYSGLPDTIPIHYNHAGEADGFGGKSMILHLPLIATVFYVGMTIMNRYPYVFNYPVKITQENALRQYTIATRVVRYLKLALVLIFGGIAFRTIQDAVGHADGLGPWFISAVGIVIIIPLLYLFLASARDK